MRIGVAGGVGMLLKSLRMHAPIASVGDASTSVPFRAARKLAAVAEAVLWALSNVLLVRRSRRRLQCTGSENVNAPWQEPTNVPGFVDAGGEFASCCQARKVVRAHERRC